MVYVDSPFLWCKALVQIFHWTACEQFPADGLIGEKGEDKSTIVEKNILKRSFEPDQIYMEMETRGKTVALFRGYMSGLQLRAFEIDSIEEQSHSQHLLLVEKLPHRVCIEKFKFHRQILDILRRLLARVISSAHSNGRNIVCITEDGKAVSIIRCTKL